jgi:lysophospholipase L1-like esterase
MAMKSNYVYSLLLALCILSVRVFAAEDRAPKIFLIGGSTMASYPATRPVVGWGQTLPKFFKNPAAIDNRALSGRSTKSFIDQGHWAEVIGDMRAGDFLIMCWGTNDSADDPLRKTDPHGEFTTNLKRFIAETRAKGATPILATQVAHRRWDAKGQWAESASEYVLVNRELAASEHLPLMEMYERTTALEKSLGKEGSIALHLYLPLGKYDSYPNGAKDDTHYNAAGATKVAELAVAEIRRLKLPFALWLTDSAPGHAGSAVEPAR